MARFCIINILFLSLTFSLHAQDDSRIEAYGFSMVKPKDWLENKDISVLKNLNRFDLKDDELKTLIESHENSLTLASYYKYHPSTRAGLIPTVNILLRPNPNRDFESFFRAIAASAASMKSVFNDFVFLEEPRMLELDGQRTIYFVCTFTMKATDGKPIKARSRNYAIPVGMTFYQLSFIDDSRNKDEDCTELFDVLQNSIRIAQK